MQAIKKALLLITLLGMIGMYNTCLLCGGGGSGAGAGAGGAGAGAGAGAGGMDADTNAMLSRLIFAQGFVGGPLPVGSTVKVPLING